MRPSCGERTQKLLLMRQETSLQVGSLTVPSRELVKSVFAGNWELFSADYFTRERRPKVLLTTNYKPSVVMFAFLADMLEVLPNAHFYKRQVGGTTAQFTFTTTC